MNDIRHDEELASHSLPPPALDVRWFAGIVLAVPLLLTVSVYWLHHQPVGPQTGTAQTIVDVSLMMDAASPPASERSLIEPSRPLEEQAVPDAVVETSEQHVDEPTEFVDASPPPPEVAELTPLEEPPALPASGGRSLPAGPAAIFQRELQQHIERYLPKASRDRHGKTQVSFSMRRDGSVSHIWIIDSSGNFGTDQAAVDTIRRAQPLPSIPKELPNSLTITLPLTFNKSRV